MNFLKTLVVDEFLPEIKKFAVSKLSKIGGDLLNKGGK